MITDVETGKDTLNVRPNDAIGMIESRGRSPLTVDEGIAFVTQYPEAVAERRLLPHLGSRCDDKRVTALWISKRTPKLGWCFAGVPHTWLRLGLVRGSGRSARTLIGGYQPPPSKPPPSNPPPSNPPPPPQPPPSKPPPSPAPLSKPPSPP